MTRREKAGAVLVVTGFLLVLLAPLTDFELAYLHAIQLGKDDENE